MSLAFINEAIYHLKREYPFPIDFYQLGEDSFNPKTGKRTVVRTRYHIAKAIVLPSLLFRKERNDGSYDVARKNIVIDGIDLPIEPTLNDTIVYDHKQFEILEVEKLENRRGYLITCQETKGKIPNEIIELQASSTFNFSETIASEI